MITEDIKNKFYNWYAGNHCFPKCSRDKILSCRKKIKEAIEKNEVKSHKEFVDLVRTKYKICDLSAADFARNVYKEPLCMHRYKQLMDKMSDREKKVFERLEELTLLLLLLTSWREEIIKGEFVQRSWKGYDFNVFNALLEKEYISFSYKAKSVMLRDKGIEKAKELIKKYKIESSQS